MDRRVLKIEPEVPPGFENHEIVQATENYAHFDKAEDEIGNLVNQPVSFLDNSKDDDLEEARKARESGKMIGFSASNKIDVIWATAKSRKDKKKK